MNLQEWGDLPLDEKIALTEADLAKAQEAGDQLVISCLTMWLDDMKRQRENPE